MAEPQRAPKPEEIPVFDLEATSAVTEARAQAGAGGRRMAVGDAAGSVADSFLPPPPMEVRESPESTRLGRPADTNPLTQADRADASPPPAMAEPVRRKGPSLFERVTGTGRARSERAQKTSASRASDGPEPRIGMGEPAPAAPARMAPAEEPARAPVAEPAPRGSDSVSPLPQAPEPRLDMEPRAAAPEPEPMPEPKADPEAAKAAPAVDQPPQADLGDLEPKGGLDKDVQEDLLEIPAFLRRQAN